LTVFLKVSGIHPLYIPIHSLYSLSRVYRMLEHFRNPQPQRGRVIETVTAAKSNQQLEDIS
jgi:hypothetical protein